MPMPKPLLALTVTALALSTGAGPIASTPTSPRPASPPPTVTVYKTPTCGCCAKWVDHLKTSGFQVTVHDQDDLTETRATLGVPRALGSCHTAVVGSYVIEGHVPADLIQRILKERPAVRGLAVPGMPAGSPGMEGGRQDRYEVLTFDRNGRTSVYASR